MPFAPLTHYELYEFVYPYRIAQQKSTNLMVDASFVGDPYENRTRVTAVKGRCLNRLTKGPLYLKLIEYSLVAAVRFEPTTCRV